MNFGAYVAFSEKWGTGSSTAAVIDSGVCYHSLLSGRVRMGGYDYVDGDEDPTNDEFGHGTRVAAIIADCTPGLPVYVYPIRVLDASGGGKMSNVVNAVREATARRVDIINLSIESHVLSDALDDAVLDAVRAGVTVVVAAGNSGINTAEVCPSHLTNRGAIVVGAAEGDDGLYRRASYSNYGGSVDVYAYGTDIMSASLSGGYGSDTGTSMAAPHISALSAMLHMTHPGLSSGKTEDRILRAAVGTNVVAVPDLALMVPQSRGFSLRKVHLNVGEMLQLYAATLPETAAEQITYAVSDAQIVNVEQGALTGLAPGTATVTVSCTGFEDTAFTVTVDETERTVLTLPASLTALKEEAFAGAASLQLVQLPEGLETIGDSAFADCPALERVYVPSSVQQIGGKAFSRAILLCEGETAWQYAENHELQYVLVQNEQ